MKLTYPEGLHPEAIKFGNDMVTELDRQNFIQDLDINLLNLAVMAYHTFATCRDDVLKNGATYKAGEFIKINPAATVMRDQMIQLYKAFDLLGMSPKARKAMAQMASSPFEGDSPLKEFLKAERRN